MSYQLYPSDLTDREWEYIKRLIPAAKSGGRKRQTDMRLTVNAIFYISRTGCAGHQHGLQQWGISRFSRNFDENFRLAEWRSLCFLSLRYSQIPQAPIIIEIAGEPTSLIGRPSIGEKT